MAKRVKEDPGMTDTNTKETLPTKEDWCAPTLTVHGDVVTITRGGGFGPDDGFGDDPPGDPSIPGGGSIP